MSERKKILKNSTVSPIELKYIGITIPASPGQRTVDPQNYGLLSAAMNDSNADAVFLKNKISNGDIVVNDGGYDLNASDGANFLRHPDDAGNVRLNSLAASTSAIGQTLQEFVNRWAGPNISQKPTYNVNGDITYIEYFTGATQTTPNRTAKTTIAYDVNLNPVTETWEIYKLDGLGTTVEKTVVFTHTFTAFDLTKTEMVTT